MESFGHYLNAKMRASFKKKDFKTRPPNDTQNSTPIEIRNIRFLK